MGEETKWETPPFIEYLFTLSPEKDSGKLADLRKGFSKATAVRAWPHIGRFCLLNNDRDRVIYETVGAGYATHPVNDGTPYANFGSVMQKLAFESVGGDAEKRKTFDTRFRRLLACESAEEVCQHIKGVILAAKAKDVPVPWESLFWDLKKWGDKVKISWATKYWMVPNEMADVTETGEMTNDESDTAGQEDE
ncbi:MAG: type I-E CRISPR-associated protein Cse2/CasB [Thermoguttaceae bacterium]|nr:type I-E CRISPR-associated protein Cse2/CasB [Thermoguttaceae bacterium]